MSSSDVCTDQHADSAWEDIPHRRSDCASDLDENKYAQMAQRLCDALPDDEHSVDDFLWLLGELADTESVREEVSTWLQTLGPVGP